MNPFESSLPIEGVVVDFLLEGQSQNKWPRTWHF